MIRLSRHIARDIKRDTAGSGALELALVLPVLMLLIVGMIDTSRMVASRIDVEQAAQRGTDFAMAVRPAGNNINGNYIGTEVARDADISHQDVTVEIFLECNGTRQNNFNSACAVGQDTARFVSVEVDRQVDYLFDWSSLTALFGSNIMGSSVTVQGDSVVRFQ